MSNIGEAIGRADAGANPEWKEAALAIVKDLASKRSHFDTDEVFARLEAAGIDTPERRAMGPVMVKAVKAGWCQIETCDRCNTTKVIKQSTRPESHGKDTAVYRSLLVRPKRKWLRR